ncbi:MAG: DNA adenine methylase [Trichocoleus desertorum ATA4-8-CV12]|jgi:DNA adenine methylase|nr:DNA adenine methylase [Trichocoleus desertorum ATA4-8-CV12]
MQSTLFGEVTAKVANQVVNVASVPQRSPFRYPGGKTWLVPRLRRWLESQPEKPREFIEPFTGGGIASLTTAFEGRAEWVTMVECDEQVAAVWRVILQQPGGGEWLADRIINFDLTPDNAHAVLCKPEPTLLEIAFRTLLKNRINHGGILASGVGILKHGENGKGIKSRWYPETLRNRILDIVNQRDNIQFIEGDGMRVLVENANRADAVFFIDPPYTVGKGKRAGARLYTYNELDHEELFRIASKLEGDFLMTYDNTQAVLELAEKFGFDTKPVTMKNTHHAEMSELLIGRNLNWLD